MAKKVAKKAAKKKSEPKSKADLGTLAEGWHKHIAKVGGDLSLALSARKLTRAQVLLWSGTLRETAIQMEMWVNDS